MPENRGCGCGCGLFGGDCDCLWIIILLIILFCCCGNNGGRGGCFYFLGTLYHKPQNIILGF